MDVQGIVQWLATAVIEGRNIDEEIDSFIDTSTTTADRIAILYELGETDLSEPMPDLRAGWQKVCGQLAYNALYAAVAAEVKSHGNG